MKKSVLFALVYFLCATSANAAALGDQWYIGLGAGSTWLQPNPRQVGVDIDRRLGVGGSLFVGADIDDRSSGQLTLYGLGDSELDNNELVAYQAFDGSVLYRLYDTKDVRLTRSGMHLALYGRFALGFLYRDSDERLVNDSAVYFGAGGGAEWFINDAFSVRLEGMYLDKDATYGSVQLVGRFGGRRRLPSRPLTRPETPAVPSKPESPTLSVPPPMSEPTTPRKSTELPEQVELVDSAEQKESTDTVQQNDSIDIAETIEAVEAVELIEPVEAEELIESVEAEELIESVEAEELIESVEAVELIESFEVVELIEPVEAVELIEPVEPIEKPEPDESVEQIEPAELVEQAELSDLIEPIETIEPSVPSMPDTETLSPDADQDDDNVPDAEDQCLASRAGYPVRSTGCALFDGLLSGVSFVAGSSALLPDASDQLDFLANVLIQYPKAEVELHAHTDNSGTVKDQTALTRDRVRTIGAYLVRQGVSIERLVLRSFGGSRPLFDSDSAEGQAGNNRVEVIESRN